jgi:hypothetical protein
MPRPPQTPWRGKWFGSPLHLKQAPTTRGSGTGSARANGRRSRNRNRNQLPKRGSGSRPQPQKGWGFLLLTTIDILCTLGAQGGSVPTAHSYYQNPYTLPTPTVYSVELRLARLLLLQNKRISIAHSSLHTRNLVYSTGSCRSYTVILPTYTHQSAIVTLLNTETCSRYLCASRIE